MIGSAVSTEGRPRGKHLIWSWSVLSVVQVFYLLMSDFRSLPTLSTLFKKVKNKRKLSVGSLWYFGLPPSFSLLLHEGTADRGVPKKDHFNNALVFPPPLKRVKRKRNYQVCENNTLVCLPLRLCTRRQQVEASVAGEAAARLVLSNTPLKWTPTAGSDHIAYCILFAARLVL